MTLRRRTLLVPAGGAALWPLATRAQAAWRTPSIRYVVPFAPGGTSEIVARTSPTT